MGKKSTFGLRTRQLLLNNPGESGDKGEDLGLGVFIMNLFLPRCSKGRGGISFSFFTL
jgi:hypothetical protein